MTINTSSMQPIILLRRPPLHCLSNRPLTKWQGQNRHSAFRAPIHLGNMLSVIDLLYRRCWSSTFTSFEHRVVECRYRAEINQDFEFEGVTVVREVAGEKVRAAIEGVGFFEEVVAEDDVAW